MSWPSLHALAAMAITGVTFWAFAKGRVRVELISLMLIAVLAMLFNFFPMQKENGVTGLELAFGGFGHEALVAICCLMIMGRGLVVTGALEPAARVLTQIWKFSKLLGLLFSLLIGAAMSMFVNDTPVLVLTMPILLNLAVRANVPASKTLMPMNCAILIGGMATTIGTSTNLLVVSIAQDLGLPRFGVFHFTDTALIAGAVALPYLWLVMPRLLPAHSAQHEFSTRPFVAALFVGDTPASGAGLTLREARQKIGDNVHVRGLRRHGLLRTADKETLAPGDQISIEGVSAALHDASAAMKTPLAHAAVLDAVKNFPRAADEDEIEAELAIGADSALIGRSVRNAQIADRYGVAVIGAYRPNRTLLQGARVVSDDPLDVGDVLLVRGTQSCLRNLQIGEGAMVLEGAAEMPRSAKAPLALAIFAAAVALAALHVTPIAVSALAGAIALIATGCVKFENIGRALSAEVIVLVAASIALGRALMETGAAAWIGSVLAFVLQAAPPAAIVAAMMVFATLLTNFSSNTAAAAVGAPIAVSLANTLNTPAEPLILAVLFGCNLCYATPVAYQTNILIMSAGGYQFRDYVRAGLPLVLLMIVTLSTLLVLKYRL